MSETAETRRASCHVQADCIVDQARTDVENSSYDVFDVLKWRLGELFNDCGLSWDCFHQDVVKQKLAEIDEADLARRILE